MDIHNYRLDIEYDGLKFFGWQRQSKTDNTVQHKIEDALQVLLKAKTTLYGAGRTDSGVSAYNQVANFKTDYIVDDYVKFTKSLDSILPRSITIKKVTEVPIDFHSRYWAKSREYFYQITTKRRSIYTDYYHHVSHEIDLSKSEKFVKSLTGVHSFKSLCKNSSDSHGFKCIMREILISENKDTGEIIVTIESNRFLHSMVRAIVGCIIDIARGKLDCEETIEKFQNQERIECMFVPASALFLNKIHY